MISKIKRAIARMNSSKNAEQGMDDEIQALRLKMKRLCQEIDESFNRRLCDSCDRDEMTKP
ncbi:hypothetical protein MFLO_10893 [Listeria floridensis FSL S10-1187]|uniref:Uncharacterized protein n=1 Tax=Listeria floridensis FSL S10-1187 TaxID=1265817 RepID=A0ABN0RDZ3_9LIST|nr:hypothetical protein [Listeria floridensis]EUJ30322.1 hypothetical protein MFLO_10893 [Listeria floridensis FSL S10-1187]